MSWEGDVDFTCSKCKRAVTLECEVSGNVYDPDWVCYPERCPECHGSWTDEDKSEIEEKVMNLSLEPSFEYDTWDEYLMDKNLDK